MAKLIILMGVSGSGKTSIGEALAQKISAQFIDGDHLHSQRNIDKMASGIPLTDADRYDWLKLIGEVGKREVDNNINCIIACSALKKSYRDIIRAENENLIFIYLKGSFELIESRLSSRKGHYMPKGLLKSQFDVLEEPKDEETDVITIEINQDISEIINEIIKSVKVS
ncbi:gluconokinase [Pedobacter fastidiosus]|uniref:Gluconokinase n=1 Tax=Pedobacter fastidiosus TaxID=2765361 RepID=A0ABR7KWR7_9SPHI|nr:gluconokinase [Pedobacter fastidiosus]MBC6112557.1 gluconokinase [Pedobacter fastidiosus]